MLSETVVERTLRKAHRKPMNSDTTSDADVAQKLQRTPEGECAFCPDEAYDWLFVYSLEDYAATNLGEEPPMRLVGVCAPCFDDFNRKSELVDKSEVPGL